MTPASRHGSPSSSTTSGAPIATMSPATGAAMIHRARRARRKADLNRAGSRAIRENAGKSTYEPISITTVPGSFPSLRP